MSVTFYKSNSKHDPDLEETIGDLEMLTTMVHETAAVEWDRFMLENQFNPKENTGVAIDTDLRFVCLAGTWRAFQNQTGDFIAQWWPYPGPIDGGFWAKKRTKAMSLDDVKRALESDMNSEDLCAALASGFFQDIKHRDGTGRVERVRRDKETDRFLQRRREGLCTRCGSQEGMLCPCEDK